jgi:signal transduction histidine kinase
VLVLSLVALLDYLTPADVSFALIYMIAVLPVAWIAGVRAGIAIAVLATALEAANARISRQDPLPVDLWNVLSGFVVLSALAVIVDLLRKRDDDLKRVDGERRTLLRLLAREFPRPLRALDWFTRMLDESLERDAVDTARRQIGALRHHVREASFLATDLLSVGSLHSGTLTFDRVEIDLRQILNEAADATLDRGRIVITLPDDPVVVQADPDRLRHAIASVLGRCAQTAYATVPVFVRAIGGEGLVHATSQDDITPADVELAELLVAGGGGRLVVAPRNAKRGVTVSIFVPLAAAVSRATSAAPVGPAQLAE